MNRRTILSALAFVVVAPVLAAQSASAATSPVRVTGIQVTSLVPNPNNLNQLIATATMSLNVAGRDITQIVQFPVALSGSPAASSTTCPILNLSIGPIHLDLLGLIVNLDNCATPPGPVTVSVTGTSGPGNLLGNLLCDIAGLLNGGLNLSDLLSRLNAQQIAALEAGLISLLNDFFSQALTQLASATPGSSGSTASGICPILHLMLNPIHLNLLGLQADTSAICLDISAQRGPGNLLGNLLCNLVHLLDQSPGGNAGPIQGLVQAINQLLTRLGL